MANQNLEVLAKAMQFERRLVQKQPGDDEKYFCSYPVSPEWQADWRWETDEEFRERMLASK